MSNRLMGRLARGGLGPEFSCVQGSRLLCVQGSRLLVVARCVQECLWADVRARVRRQARLAGLCLRGAGRASNTEARRVTHDVMECNSSPSSLVGKTSRKASTLQARPTGDETPEADHASPSHSLSPE